jgi:glucose-6-phosphate 1-dehydrogenase
MIQGWEQEGIPELLSYPQGSWGPAEADELLAREGRRWRMGCQDEEETIHTGI